MFINTNIIPILQSIHNCILGLIGSEYQPSDWNYFLLIITSFLFSVTWFNSDWFY